MAPIKPPPRSLERDEQSDQVHMQDNLHSEYGTNTGRRVDGQKQFVKAG